MFYLSPRSCNGRGLNFLMMLSKMTAKQKLIYGIPEQCIPPYKRIAKDSKAIGQRIDSKQDIPNPIAEENDVIQKKFLCLQR